MSNGSQGAGPQAGQQGQGSGTTTSQGTTQGQGQSLGDQLYGQQGQPQGQQGQGASQSGTGDGQLLEGQRAGESLADYGRRMASELTRARQDAGRYRTQLRQYTGTDDGQPGDNQQGGTQGQQPGQGQDTPLAQLQGQVAALQRDLQAERTARKGERTSAALVNALSSAGAVAPQRARLLVDSTELTVAADGTPTPESVQAAIDALKADMPQLFTDVRGSGDGGAGNTGDGDPQDFNAQIRRRAGR